MSQKTAQLFVKKAQFESFSVFALEFAIKIMQNNRVVKTEESNYEYESFKTA